MTFWYPASFAGGGFISVGGFTPDQITSATKKL